MMKKKEITGKLCYANKYYSSNICQDLSSSNSEDRAISPQFTPPHLIESHVFDQKMLKFAKIEEGEKEIAFMDLQAVDINEAVNYTGHLMITRYKLVFKPFKLKSRPRLTTLDEYDMTTDDEPQKDTTLNIEEVEYLDLPTYKRRFFTIPVHLLYSASFQLNKKNTNEAYVDIDTKDFRTIRFIVDNLEKATNLYKDIVWVAFPTVLSKEVFALKYQ